MKGVTSRHRINWHEYFTFGIFTAKSIHFPVLCIVMPCAFCFYPEDKSNTSETSQQWMCDTVQYIDVSTENLASIFTIQDFTLKTKVMQAKPHSRECATPCSISTFRQKILPPPSRYKILPWRRMQQTPPTLFRFPLSLNSPRSGYFPKYSIFWHICYLLLIFQAGCCVMVQLQPYASNGQTHVTACHEDDTV